MAQKICEKKGIVCLQDMRKEENLAESTPSPDMRCEVCYKLVSELKPFGGPGDPLVGDHNGELLVNKWRPFIILNQKEANAWVNAVTMARDNLLSWFVERYGEEEGRKLFDLGQDIRGEGSWECRDCIVMDDEEYWIKERQIGEKFLVRDYIGGEHIIKDPGSLYVTLQNTEGRLEDLWLAMREGKNTFDQFKEVLWVYLDLHSQAIELNTGRGRELKKLWFSHLIGESLDDVE
jgi:hypothetical protein